MALQAGERRFEIEIAGLIIRGVRVGQVGRQNFGALGTHRQRLGMDAQGLLETDGHLGNSRGSIQL